MTNRQTVHLKKAFLDSFSQTGNISESCRAVGLKTRHIVYEWQEHDDQFSAAFREAEIKSTEVLETEARVRAVDGTLKPVYQGGELVGHITEKSDTLLIFLLKARNPAKYRDNAAAGQRGDRRDAEKLAEQFAEDFGIPIEAVVAELDAIMKART